MSADISCVCESLKKVTEVTSGCGPVDVNLKVSAINQLWSELKGMIIAVNAWV